MKKLTRLVPPWEIADYPRYLFKQALRKETPEVLESLAEDVLPAYRAITPEIARQSYKPAIRPTVHVVLPASSQPIDGNQMPLFWWSIEAGAGESPEAAELKSKLWKWAERFHLTDEWLLDVAAQTLYSWRDPNNKTIGANWGHLPTQVFGSISVDECKFEIADIGWDVEVEPWQTFEARITKQFQSQLREQMLMLAEEQGYEPAPQIRNKKHFDWLAMYQVCGFSPKDVANHFQIETRRALNVQNTVWKAIEEKAAQISLTLRKSNSPRRRNVK